MTATFTRTTGQTSDPKDWWRRVCWVDTQLAVSGDLPADPAEALEHLNYWVQEGITDVFDMREEADDSEFITANSGIVPRWFGIDDNGTSRPDRWFDTVVASAAEVLVDPNRRLLVHCHMGINRGPSSLLAIMLAQGWAPTDALDAIRVARPIAGIIYAGDAVSWWSRTSGHTVSQTADHVRDVSNWFDDNGIDIGKVIRRIRQ